MRYREAREQLAAVAEVGQEAVDRLLGREAALPEQVVPGSLPKGIDPLTLERVVKGLAAAAGSLTAEEFGAATGLSRSTARRYLEYLVAEGRAEVQASYGDVGRPERLYDRKRRA